MFSPEEEYHFANTLMILTKAHRYQPSELLNMTYTDFMVTIQLIEQYVMKENEANRAALNGY